MSTVQEQILEVVGSRFANISTGNGYSIDINSIKREKITDFQRGDVPILFYWGENDSLLELSYNREKRQMIIGCALFVRSQDSYFTDRAFQLGADIKTALNRKTAAPKVSDAVSSELGGIINSLIVNEIVPIVGEGQTPFCGVVMSFPVEYFVATHDSYSLL